ncbi:MAG: HIT family protein [Lachnospiraceae bacterium]|nr:HIT family protein [Lachnospiraceae bacterium]
MDCIFCQIINRELPSYILHEDDDFMVILDQFPQSKGHTIVLPKTHAEDIFALQEKELERLMPLAGKVAARLKETVNYEGLSIVQRNGVAAGQSIFHFHLHLIPRFLDDGVSLDMSGEKASASVLQSLYDSYCSPN